MMSCQGLLVAGYSKQYGYEAKRRTVMSPVVRTCPIVKVKSAMVVV